MPRRKPTKVVVAVDFAPPRPARRSGRWLLVAGLLAAAGMAAAALIVTQLLLR